MEKAGIKREIEEIEGLQVRRSTQLPNKQNSNYIEEDDVVINGELLVMSNGNENDGNDHNQENVDINSGVDNYLVSAPSEELRSSVVNGGIEVSEAEVKEEVDQESSENCVYYQNNEGTGSTNALSLNGHSSNEHTGQEKIHGDGELDMTIKSLDNGHCLSQESKLEHEKQLKHSSLSGSSHLPSEISPEENNTSFSFFSYKTIESSDTNLLYVSDRETTKLDVERVLRKQDTHDLYCPNCNSCITSRVIIRKRKRRLPNSGEDGKRNKLENVTGSDPISTSVAITSSPSHSTVDTCLDGGGAPASNKDDQDQEPDVFRCLSCFSIFVPTGNGFKLFRMFGDRRDKDNLQDPLQTPLLRKSWFTTLFQSDKRVSRRENVGTDDTEVLIPSNSTSQDGKFSSIHESSSHGQTDFDGEPVKTGIKASTEGGTNQLSPQKVSLAEPGNLVNIEDQIFMNLNRQNGEAPVNEAPSHAIYADGEIVQSEITGSNEEGASLEQSDATFNLLESLKFPKEVLLNHEGEHPEITLAGSQPTTAGEAAEISTFIPQENGLKFFIPSDVSSFIVETSKTDQKVNVTIPNKSSEKKHHAEVSQHNKAEVYTNEPLKADHSTPISLIQNILLLQEQQVNLSNTLKDTTAKKGSVSSDIVIVETSELEPPAAHRVQNLTDPAETGIVQHLETHIQINEQRGISKEGIQGLEIIKSIVYGGLVESIASLGVVSSAAGSDAATVNVLALGLANLIGGLIIIGHNLSELKDDQKTEASNQLAEPEQVDRYHELLGQRRNFLLHVVFAILSFLTFGLIPPVFYGFSFWKSDDRDLKLVTVAAASLLGITILATGKAYVKRAPKSYIKTVLYYVVMGLMVSGVSYAVGNLINMFLEKLGFFQSSSVITLSETGLVKPAWASF